MGKGRARSAPPFSGALRIKRIDATGGEVLYLDTAPHSDTAALKVAEAADLVLIPCRTAILDLEAITDTLRFIGTTGTPACVVLNAIAPSGQDADQAAAALTRLAVEICPVRLGHRIAFARALITGLAAQEFEPAGRAAQEIELLHTFISERAHVHTINRSLFKCAMTLQML